MLCVWFSFGCWVSGLSVGFGWLFNLFGCALWFTTGGF